MVELDPSGRLPERAYSKNELLEYLQHGRSKCRETIMKLTEERVREHVGMEDWSAKMPFGELLLYTMRHVMDHTGELNLLLGHTHSIPPDWGAWVSRAKSQLGEDA